MKQKKMINNLFRVVVSMLFIANSFAQERDSLSNYVSQFEGDKIHTLISNLGHNEYQIDSCKVQSFDYLYISSVSLYVGLHKIDIDFKDKIKIKNKNHYNTLNSECLSSKKLHQKIISAIYVTSF